MRQRSTTTVIADRPSVKSLKSAARRARKDGAACGRRIAAYTNASVEDVRQDVEAGVQGIEAILDRRLATLAREMSGLRAAIKTRLEGGKEALKGFNGLKTPARPTYPSALPVMLNPWVLCAELLIVICLETILCKPALEGLREYAGNALWILAALVGIAMALVVYGAGKGMAHTIRNPLHRHSDRNRMAWVAYAVFTGLLLILLVLMAFCFAYSRDINIGNATALDQILGGLGTAVNPLEDMSSPSMLWSLVLQLGVLTAGVLTATCWHSGAEIRAHKKVRDQVAHDTVSLEELDRRELGALEEELAEGAARYGAFVEALREAFVEDAEEAPIPQQLLPKMPPAPNRQEKIRKYFALTGKPVPEHLVVKADTPSENGAGPKEHVPPLDIHHD